MTDVTVMSAVVIRPQTAQRTSTEDAIRKPGPNSPTRIPIPKKQYTRVRNSARKAVVPRVPLEEGSRSRGRQRAPPRSNAAKRSNSTVIPRNLPTGPALIPGSVSARTDGITPMGIKRAIATNSMKPAKRFLRQLLPRLLESAVGVPPCGVAVTLCAIIAPITLPRQPETMIQVHGGKLTSSSNGATQATSVGNFAQNLRLPLGATQNWQNARYSAAATQGAMSSPFEFSKADPAPKVTIIAVIPRKRETTTIMRMRDQSLRVFINPFMVGSAEAARPPCLL